MVKRILVVQCDTVITTGLVQYLSTFDHLKVDSLTIADLDQLPRLVQEIQPHVLIYDEECLQRSTEGTFSLHFLARTTCVRSLAINHRDNSVSVYENYQIVLHQLSDFLAML